MPRNRQHKQLGDINKAYLEQCELLGAPEDVLRAEDLIDTLQHGAACDMLGVPDNWDRLPYYDFQTRPKVNEPDWDQIGAKTIAVFPAAKLIHDFWNTSETEQIYFAVKRLAHFVEKRQFEQAFTCVEVWRCGVIYHTRQILNGVVDLDKHNWYRESNLAAKLTTADLPALPANEPPINKVETVREYLRRALELLESPIVEPPSPERQIHSAALSPDQKSITISFSPEDSFISLAWGAHQRNEVLSKSPHTITPDSVLGSAIPTDKWGRWVGGNVVIANGNDSVGLELEDLSPVETIKWLRGLGLEDMRRKAIPLSGGDAKYQPPHPTFGAFDCLGEWCNDHGGWIYMVENGKALKRGPFHGGFTWKQWSEDEPGTMYGFEKGVFYRWHVNDDRAIPILGLNDVRELYPEVVRIIAGENEGMALYNGKIHFQGTNNKQGWHLSYNLKTKKLSRTIEPISFTYSESDQPDFGSAGFLDDSFFVKVVKQSGENTKTPWWIDNGENVIRSSDKFLGHGTPAIMEYDGQDIPVISVIGGKQNSMLDGRMLRNLNLSGDLNEHVGPFFGVGAKTIIWNDAKGGLFATDLFGEFKTYKLASNAAKGDMGYACGFALRGMVLILYRTDSGERIILKYERPA